MGEKEALYVRMRAHARDAPPNPQRGLSVGGCTTSGILVVLGMWVASGPWDAGIPTNRWLSGLTALQTTTISVKGGLGAQPPGQDSENGFIA